MSDTTNNMPVPDFADEDEQAVQAAQNALASGRNKPLTVPPSAEVFVSDKTSAKYSRFTEQVTIENAYRSVTNDGSKIDVALMLRVRQSEVNSGRTMWAHFYIAPTTEGLKETQIEYREKQRGLVFSLIKALGFVPESGKLTGSLQNMLFPQKGEPGKSSPLVGKGVFAEICQQDSIAKDKNGAKIQNEDGTFQRDVRDAVEGWIADSSDEA
jgi:hypothetical protein